MTASARSGAAERSPAEDDPCNIDKETNEHR